MGSENEKPGLPGALTLLVAGAGIILLSCLSLPAEHIRLRGGTTISRAEQPVLFWGYEVFTFAAGICCIVVGAQKARNFFRWQREFEQRAYDEFLEEKKGARNVGGQSAERE